ncbi:MAG TPA: beta-propeller fold lactonase family protein [Candidatus Solibacter sp.]|nr:beta-propeller fold lactonase family protein [Candidatus Solibacter sp.]
MSTRFAWLLGLVVLVSFGVLVACGTKYSSSSDGLVIVGSQGSATVETFSFNLSNGHISGISNTPGDTGTQTCLLPGLPSSMVIDPSGTYVYAIINQTDTCDGSQTGITSFNVKSDGTIGAVGSIVADPNPVALAIDSSGKFLFVAEGLASTALNNYNAKPSNFPCTQSNDPLVLIQYGICVYSINAGTITPVPQTFATILPSGAQVPNFAALALTPTVFPSNGINGQQSAVCSTNGITPPSNEFLYIADSVNNVVYEFVVDMSTGVLSNPPNPGFLAAGTVPSGVAVDACDRFVYVSNQTSNNVSAYTICNGMTTQSATCPATADGSLVSVPGSPFSLSAGANGPGPILSDPFGKFLYVLDQKSDMVSPFKIAQVTGALTSQAVASTGLAPTGMAIRGDDNWLFVTNFNSATMSQYAITPATGALSPQPTVATDNFPWGVAVK